MNAPTVAGVVVLAIVPVLAGCGGSGGAVRPDGPPCIRTHSGDCHSPAEFASAATPRAAAYREDASFASQWGLEAIRAHWAYAHLETLEGEDAEPGSGVTIGFVDTGIDRQHPIFAGKTITEEFLLGASDETATGFEFGDFSHGTAVASIAAGRPVGISDAPQGVAWSADIAMFAIPLGTADSVYDPISLEALAGADTEWAELAGDVLGAGSGLDILNLSFGYEGVIDNYSEHDLRINFGRTIDTLAQTGAAEKTILVWAAGNAHGRFCVTSASNLQCVDGAMDAVSVELVAGLAARMPELRDHSIAVVALQDGMSGAEIADFSNRCGIAADYCIAAPGAGVAVAYFGEEGRGYAVGGGTSFAAPMVSGGLALMKQLFRDQLSNTDLVDRLLATADDGGRFADRTVYGRGLMDLEAATSPVGVLDVPTGSRAQGPGTPLRRTGIQPGAAFGDGFGRSLAGREIVALDAFGAPFWFDLGSFADVGAAPAMSARLHDFMALNFESKHASAYGIGVRSDVSPTRSRELSDRWRLGLLEAPVGAESGHLGIAGPSLAFNLTDRRTLSATAFTTGGEFEQTPVSGASFAVQPLGSPLGFHAGWVAERETLLGSSTDGAFGALASDAVFAGIRANVDFGGWRMSANAEIGTVDSAARGGLITEISPLTTSAFSILASRPLDGDGTLRVSVSQPLRVEHGQASFMVPAGRTKAGEVVRSSVSADIAPSGRQIDVAAHWHQPLNVGELRLGAVVTHQTGHRAAEDFDLTLLSGWRLTF